MNGPVIYAWGRETVCAAIVFASVAVAGCSSSGIVGNWQGEQQGQPMKLSLFSDGTGHIAAAGGPTQAVKWVKAEGKVEVTNPVNEFTLSGTLRENGTLVFSHPDFDELLVMKRK